MPDALAIAYAYLNRRERTVAEVRARLEQAECSEEESEGTIRELLEYGYLDDSRFARIFIEDKRNLESWGRERIQRNLAERGIEREVISAALGDSSGPSEPTELERAAELLRRRYPHPDPADPRAGDRAFGMLVRKGYDSEVAADAVHQWRRAG